MKEMWEAIAAISTGLGVVGTAGGLIFVAFQIRDARKAVQSQFINELSVEAASMYDTYTKLLPGESWSSSEIGPQTRDELTKIIAYLGFFAKIKFLIEKKAIDIATVDRMFTFRFFLVIHNRHVQEKILYSDLYEDYWAGLFALHYLWVDFRKSNDLEIPWSANSLESFDHSRYLSLIQDLAEKRLL